MSFNSANEKPVTLIHRAVGSEAKTHTSCYFWREQIDTVLCASFRQHRRVRSAGEGARVGLPTATRSERRWILLTGSHPSTVRNTTYDMAFLFIITFLLERDAILPFSGDRANSTVSLKSQGAMKHEGFVDEGFALKEGPSEIHLHELSHLWWQHLAALSRDVFIKECTLTPWGPSNLGIIICQRLSTFSPWKNLLVQPSLSKDIYFLSPPPHFFCLNCVTHQGKNLCQKVLFTLAHWSMDGWVTIPTHTAHRPQTVPLPACVPSCHVAQQNQPGTLRTLKAPILTPDGCGRASSEYTSSENSGFPRWKRAKKREGKTLLCLVKQ